jgi:hypothetical protein
VTGGNSNTHYPGKWLVSVRVRTEERVQPLLYLSISKSYQLSSTDSPLSTVDNTGDGLINSWLINQNPCQQSIADNELIVDKVCYQQGSLTPLTHTFSNHESHSESKHYSVLPCALLLGRVTPALLLDGILFVQFFHAWTDSRFSAFTSYFTSSTALISGPFRSIIMRAARRESPNEYH